MKLSPEFTLRKVADEYLIVNPFQSTVDTTRVYTLNESAAFLWEKLKEKDSFNIEDISELLQAEYEVAPEMARNDAEELVAQWETAGFLLK